MRARSAGGFVRRCADDGSVSHVACFSRADFCPGGRHRLGDRRDQPDGAADRARDPPRLVVLLDVVALEDPGRLEHAPDELADQVGRPPEPASEHDHAGDRQQDRARDALQDQPGYDQDDHAPLVRFARRSIEEDSLDGGS